MSKETARKSFQLLKFLNRVHPGVYLNITKTLVRPTCDKCDVHLDFDFNDDGSYRIFCPKCGWIKGKEENVMSQKEWWIRAYQKLIENMLSIKVWVLAANALVSAFLVYKLHTEANVAEMFSDWCAFNGGVVTAIIGMREAFKVAKVKNGNRENKDVMV
jgi:hypothetical protein